MIPRAIAYGNEQDWLESRRAFIGASESPALVGEGYEGQTPLRIWAQKVHGLDMEADPDLRKRLLAGRAMESAAIRVAAIYSGIEVEAAGTPTVCVHPDKDFIRCTLDGWTEDGRVVEAKFCTVPHLHSQWESGGLPDRFIVQVQHQLACTGWDSAMIVAICIGRQPIIQEVPRNEEFIGKLVDYLNWWWHTFVIGRESPPMDGDESTKRLLHNLYGPGVAGTCQRIGDMDATIEEYEDLGRKIEALKEERERRGNQIRDAIGSCEYGVTTDGRTVSWKEVHRREYTVAASSSRTLRIVKSLPRNVRFI